MPSNLFQSVKEFNLFSVADIKVNLLSNENDIIHFVFTKGSMKLSAKVQLRVGYPIVPPLFFLQMEKVPKCANEVILPPEYQTLMDNSD